MSAKPSETARRRVCVPLDPEMLIEALVLARLEALPKRRRADWVRGLLVQGFLTESRVIRVLQTGAPADGDESGRLPATRTAGFTFGERLTRPGWTEPAARAGAGDERPLAPKTDQPDKPFAHLRKVVG